MTHVCVYHNDKMCFERTLILSILSLLQTGHFSFVEDSKISCLHFPKVNSQNFTKMQQMDTPGQVL